MANCAEALLEMTDLERQTRLLPSSGGLEELTEKQTLKENRARTVSGWTLPGSIGDGLAKGSRSGVKGVCWVQERGARTRKGLAGAGSRALCRGVWLRHS